MERLRTFKVTVEIDTNKATYEQSFDLDEYESTGEAMQAAKEWAESRLEDM